jgi:hypothetical protein
VTYTHESDAIEAVRSLNRCTTKGRVITVTRVASPSEKSHVAHVKSTLSNKTTGKSSQPKIDRHAPRPAVSRGGKGRDGRGQKKSPLGSRPKKTIAELDEEMNVYFAGVQQEQTPALGGQDTNTMEGTAQMAVVKAADVGAETMEVDFRNLML